MNNILLCGNPNVGKSSIYNILTHSHEHTGNWTGVTVDKCKSKIIGTDYFLIDLPGTYSLFSLSEEELITRDVILNSNYKKIIYVMDANNIEKNMNLLLQILEINKNVILCINMIDEINDKGISIDTNKLSSILGIDIVCVSSLYKTGFDELINLLNSSKISSYERINDEDNIDETYIKINEISNNICDSVVRRNKKKKISFFDKLSTNKITFSILMIFIMICIFFITIVIANYPSELLSYIFDRIESYLYSFSINSGISNYIYEPIISIYRVVSFIVSVMFPPLVIFFFLFTYLEEAGILPRIAFNLDKVCNKCSCHGKHVLTMCSGFGCNACAVVGSKIIDSKRDRLLAIITNSFIPCNGRFPLILAIISMFFSNNKIISSIYLTIFVIFSIFISFLVTKLLSNTILKGYSGFFILELPDYKKVNIKKIFITSFIYKSLSILKKAIIVSIPAGIIIYILTNINISGISLYIRFIEIIDPISKYIGLDGVTLSSFILGFPANEIVLPLMMMGYMNSNSLIDINNLESIKNILLVNGWNIKIAISTILFSIMHFPCGTTFLTIKKEVGLKWALVSFIIPLIIGIIFLLIFNLIML